MLCTGASTSRCRNAQADENTEGWVVEHHHGDAVDRKVEMRDIAAEIGKLLTEENLNWRRVQDHTLSLSFITSNFTNRSGEHRLVVLLQVHDGGRYLTARVPLVFQPRGEYAQETMELLLCLHSVWELVQFRYDGTDGFVRPSVDLPLSTVDLDASSLGVFIRTLAGEVESTLSAVKHTLATGEIVVPWTSATPPASWVSGP